jgi:hypothetical protein
MHGRHSRRANVLCGSVVSTISKLCGCIIRCFSKHEIQYVADASIKNVSTVSDPVASVGSPKAASAKPVADGVDAKPMGALFSPSDKSNANDMSPLQADRVEDMDLPPVLAQAPVAEPAAADDDVADGAMPNVVDRWEPAMGGFKVPVLKQASFLVPVPRTLPPPPQVMQMLPQTIGFVVVVVFVVEW